MEKIALLLIIFASLRAWSIPPSDSMYLVSKTQFGLIKKTTTYNDMITLFGKGKLTEDTRSGAEGEGEFKCTVIYADTELEMVVYWQEDAWHKKISSIECSQKKSPYHTKEGLKIGSTLTDMVKVNGAAISFYGFEWDYGGLITNYNKGKLEKSKVFFTLGWAGSSNDTTLLGDGEFSSKSAKVIKRAKQVKITTVRINFE